MEETWRCARSSGQSRKHWRLLFRRKVVTNVGRANSDSLFYSLVTSQGNQTHRQISQKQCRRGHPLQGRIAANIPPSRRTKQEKEFAGQYFAGIRTGGEPYPCPPVGPKTRAIEHGSSAKRHRISRNFRRKFVANSLREYLRQHLKIGRWRRERKKRVATTKTNGQTAVYPPHMA